MSIISALEKIAQMSIKVDVNQAFVRPNEVRRLVGSSAKLVAAIGPLAFPSIDETLGWMYQSALA